MRVGSYRQYCALAKALDLIGDRWTLLIVRELLGRGPLRYTDLRDGLPGIASNLLASRLRALENAGLLRKQAAPPPNATSLFHLTPRGEALRPAILELGRWGAPLLAEAPASDAFLGQWLAWPVELCLRDREPNHPPTAIQVLVGDEAVVVETRDGAIRTRLGRAERADAALAGPRGLVVAALMGTLSLNEARAHGLRFEGDPAALQRLQPSVAGRSR
ncbi:MAG: winged helix-turn-helix transcriptional regulator [Candidatus Tumulicola sp.]